MNAKPTIPGWLVALIVVGVIAFAVLHHAPAPGPGPQPNPPGPNPPAPVDLHGAMLVVITDNDNRTQGQADIIYDLNVLPWVKESGLQFLTYDVGSAAYKTHGYDQLLAKVSLKPPAVILFSADRAAHWSATFPADTPALKTWLASLAMPRGPPEYEDKELPFVVVNGEKRYLAALPQALAKLPQPRGGPWSRKNPVIPRSAWKEVNWRDKFPASEFIYNQGQDGSCVGNASTGALRYIRIRSGFADVRLAPGNLYSQINGGRDRGAVISDALTALQQTGVCSSAFHGGDQDPIYTRQQPKGWEEDAARFRVEEAYKLNNYDEIVSSIELGYTVVVGVMAGDAWSHPDKEGVLPIIRGPGNHCTFCDGVHKLSNGQWALDMVNSWGADWGPWKSGRAYLVEQHFKGVQMDCFAIKTATEDPKNPPKKPVMKLLTGDCKCDPCRCEPCECGPLPPNKTNKPNVPPDGVKPKQPVYRWDDCPRQIDLRRDGQQIGIYWKADGKYYSRDNAQDEFVPSTSPVPLPDYARPARPALAPSLTPFAFDPYCPPGRS